MSETSDIQFYFDSNCSSKFYNKNKVCNSFDHSKFTGFNFDNGNEFWDNKWQIEHWDRIVLSFISAMHLFDGSQKIPESGETINGYKLGKMLDNTKNSTVFVSQEPNTKEKGCIIMCLSCTHKKAVAELIMSLK